MESTPVSEAMKALREAVLAEVESRLPTVEHTIQVGETTVIVSINPGADLVIVKVKKFCTASGNQFKKRASIIYFKLDDLPLVPAGGESPIFGFRDFDKDKAASRLGEEIIG